MLEITHSLRLPKVGTNMMVCNKNNCGVKWKNMQKHVLVNGKNMYHTAYLVKCVPFFNAQKKTVQILLCEQESLTIQHEEMIIAQGGFRETQYNRVRLHMLLCTGNQTNTRAPQ